jgi:NAD(P)-dependent dehydrogenase (short-subunit alcohol dehydrogenase family)
MAPVLVTGSASGIGAATAAVLRAAGRDVLGLDLHDADITADLSTPDGRERARDAVTDRCAGVLDGLVCCAGLGPQVADPALIVAVNYFGTMSLVDGLLPALRAGAEPAAVVVSSVASAHVRWADNPIAAAVEAGDEAAAAEVVRDAGPYRGNIAYAGTKNALTVAVRRRVAEWGAAGVRLNTVAPGAVDTPLLRAGLDDPMYGPAIRDFVAPVPRRGRAEEIAGLIGYLLGPAAGYVHGAQFVIDGGVDALLRPTMF